MQALSCEDLSSICNLTKLDTLELGNCDQIPSKDLFGIIGQRLANLKSLRLERGKFDENIGQLANLKHLHQLEIIDFEMIQGFREGLISLQSIKKLLLIPSYKDEVIHHNSNPLMSCSSKVFIRMIC